MSERGLPIADGAQACPFVAFEDDRDERASTPDHRHRCYAEIRPAPRALAHQEAYCLSSAFPVCPTFQDWARREAARARTAAPPRRIEARRIVEADEEGAADQAATATLGVAAMASAAADRADESDDAGAELRPGETDLDVERPGSDDRDDGDDDGESAPRHYDDEEPRRNPPREWSAPPPWLASAEVGGHDRPVDPPVPEFPGRRAEPGQGLAGSAADRLAGGQPVLPRRTLGVPPVERQPEPEPEPRVARTPPPGPRRPRAYGQHLGGPSSGPDWERPRRYEAYPTIRTRIGMPEIPRIALMAAAVAIAALALFFLPALLGVGGDNARPGASPAASPPASGVPSESIEPTPTPAPTPILYTIKSGDTLSRIATANGLTLDQLLAANPDITNPNRITVGQQIVIPTSSPSPPAQFGSPSASPSP